jgi:hypothetical protein
MADINYYELIRNWGKARNIIGGGSTPIDQFIKGTTEAAELWANVLGKEPAKLKDDIGDTLVCLTQSYGIAGSVVIEDAASHADQHLASLRKDYEAYGEWALKRFALKVLRSMSDISTQIEHAQFEPDRHCPDRLSDETAELVAVLTVIAENQGWTLEECLEEAYNDIKDRKGVMFNGGFVKEASLSVERAQEMLASGTVGGVGAEYLNDYISANS